MKLTRAQVDQMAALREQGWSYDRLARRYGVTPGAIHYRCLTVGALSPRSKPIDYPQRRSQGWGFHGPIRHFSPEEDARLLELERAGAKVAQIAAELDRARTSVRVRLLTLSAKAELA